MRQIGTPKIHLLTPQGTAFCTTKYAALSAESAQAQGNSVTCGRCAAHAKKIAAYAQLAQEYAKTPDVRVWQGAANRWWVTGATSAKDAAARLKAHLVTRGDIGPGYRVSVEHVDATRYVER